MRGRITKRKLICSNKEELSLVRSVVTRSHGLQQGERALKSDTENMKTVRKPFLLIDFELGWLAPLTSWLARSIGLAGLRSARPTL